VTWYRLEGNYRLRGQRVKEEVQRRGAPVCEGWHEKVWFGQGGMKRFGLVKDDV